MQSAVVNKIIPFSCVDGPGNRTAIFLQGCPFSCLYCHNPETINRCTNCGQCVGYCKTGALTFSGGCVSYDIEKCVLCDECFHHCPFNSSPRTRLMSAGDVMREVEKNLPFIRGITVSGGECTQWRDFLIDLFTLAHAKGLNCLLDSNGSYDFSADPALMSVTDGVMLDIKAWDETEHINLTGRGNKTVKDNLEFLAGCEKLPEVRTVVVPELFNCRETVERTASFLAGRGCFDTRYKIIQFRPNGVRPQYKSLVPPGSELLQSLADTARGYGLRDVVII